MVPVRTQLLTPCYHQAKLLSILQIDSRMAILMPTSVDQTEISNVQMWGCRALLCDGCVQALRCCLCCPAQPPEGASAVQDCSQWWWKVSAQQLRHWRHEHRLQPAGCDAHGWAASAAAAALRRAVSCAPAMCGQQYSVRSIAGLGTMQTCISIDLRMQAWCMLYLLIFWGQESSDGS